MTWWCPVNEARPDLLPASRRIAAPIRICVIDDHPIVHDGLRYMVSKTPDIEFCGGALSGPELEALLRTVSPDILLFDVNLNGEKSFALCRRIKDRYPNIRILIVSAFGDAHLLQKSIQAGASGYALKSVSMAELPSAIRHLHEMGTYFSPPLSDYVLHFLSRPSKGDAEISPRESAIIRLIGQGSTNSEIARELALSVHTVKFHVSQMLQQYHCRRRSELVTLAEHFR